MAKKKTLIMIKKRWFGHYFWVSLKMVEPISVAELTFYFQGTIWLKLLDIRSPTPDSKTSSHVRFPLMLEQVVAQPAGGWYCLIRLWPWLKCTGCHGLCFYMQIISIGVFKLINRMPTLFLLGCWVHVDLLLVVVSLFVGLFVVVVLCWHVW